jgi:hypothetical protein
MGLNYSAAFSLLLRMLSLSISDGRVIHQIELRKLIIDVLLRLLTPRWDNLANCPTFQAIFVELIT